MGKDRMQGLVVLRGVMNKLSLKLEGFTVGFSSNVYAYLEIRVRTNLVGYSLTLMKTVAGVMFVA